MKNSSPHQNQPIVTAGKALNEAGAALVLVHGRGDSAKNFITLANELYFPDLTYLAPQASGNTWYPFSFLAPITDNEPGISSGIAAIGDLMAKINAAGIPDERIMLAGFSQGGVLAFHTALYYPKRLAGILALSTFLADSESLGSGKAEVNAQIPILMCHGQQDVVLPMALGKSAFTTLKRAGYMVEWRDYPMGHEVCLEEIQEISRWLQSVLGLHS